jgi:formate hydrogenlyase subunit 4
MLSINFETILVSIIQILLVLVFSPLVSGIIKKIKSFLQCRKGSSVFQPYRDLLKFFGRESTVSENSSLISVLAPFIVFTAYLTACAFLPFLGFKTGSGYDLITFIYCFGVARFFIALAGMESGSSFGGMGSSREMMISTLSEPVLSIVLFALSLSALSFNLNNMLSSGWSTPGILLSIPLFVIVIAESSRLPVDNPDTHLELTMVHEGMILEYSGGLLGVFHYASMLKQFILIALFVSIFSPNVQNFFFAIVLKIFFFIFATLLLAFIESVVPKMRLFRLPGFFFASGILGVLAILIYFTK